MLSCYFYNITYLYSIEALIEKMIDKNILCEKELRKLEELKNPKVMEIVEKYTKHCRPSKVKVITDSEEDVDYVREGAITKGEEKKTNIEGHTIHYDNYQDQARDKANTRVLLPKGKTLSKHIKTIDKEEGLKEIMGFMEGCMEGKEMLVCFYCLGPTNSKFSIPALQLTDSFYVAHNEDLLYRKGYSEFKRLEGSGDFFHFIHSAGELDERNTTKNIDKRRIYIDLEDERVLSVNNQYGGNSVGLKKLALRLAISRAAKEDWLCEHMFIMGARQADKNRITYFSGAFPSLCGKTSTAMISGQTIVGDDIAYLRIDEGGICKAVNVECGIFGVIKDINDDDDPVIYKTLTTPRELIIANILEHEGNLYWLGMGKETPKKGNNHSGEWSEGKKDDDGNTIDISHKNARFTLRINDLDNADSRADDPEGVPIKGIIYGGRDSNTSVPVAQTLSWGHGAFAGAALESETTAATLGQEGELKHSPMANMDFLVIPLGTYIEKHLKFGEDCANPPEIFTTNYFLKDEKRKFLNGKLDKKVWLMWMEGRVHGEYDGIETPIGLIPKHEDLKRLFKEVFDKEYGVDEYVEQFSIRAKRYLDKLERIESIYNEEENVPDMFKKQMDEQRQRLLDSIERFGKDVISPLEFLGLHP
ncbi:phosphoenolpyruvate carboxykinase (GTP) [Candidatus Woesearchaeota archaeon]|nr:phosphoenolpyruvate carboxykinase (GTP) [Candidatus Woesearchaeota archaeon]